MMADDAVVASFIQRLEAGEMEGQFNVELTKLSSSQLLILARMLAGYLSHQANQVDKSPHSLTSPAP